MVSLVQFTGISCTGTSGFSSGFVLDLRLSLVHIVGFNQVYLRSLGCSVVDFRLSVHNTV